MTFAPDDKFFIIRLRHQSVFGSIPRSLVQNERLY